MVKQRYSSNQVYLTTVQTRKGLYSWPRFDLIPFNCHIIIYKEVWKDWLRMAKLLLFMKLFKIMFQVPVANNRNKLGTINFLWGFYILVSLLKCSLEILICFEWDQLHRLCTVCLSLVVQKIYHGQIRIKCLALCWIGFTIDN